MGLSRAVSYVALRLGRTVSEVEAMTVDEFRAVLRALECHGR